MIIERQEVIATTEKRIECPETHYMLARGAMRGVLLWCHPCKRQHLYTWEQLDALRLEFRPVVLVCPMEEQVS